MFNTKRNTFSMTSKSMFKAAWLTCSERRVPPSSMEEQRIFSHDAHWAALTSLLYIQPRALSFPFLSIPLIVLLNARGPIEKEQEEAAEEEEEDASDGANYRQFHIGIMARGVGQRRVGPFKCGAIITQRLQTSGGPNDNAGSTVSMMWVLGVIRHEASDGF